MNKQMTQILKLVAALSFVTACTKSRQAELPDDNKKDIYAISEFGEASEESQFIAKIQTLSTSVTASKSMKALESAETGLLSSEDVTVPERLKFMFDSLPLTGSQTKQFNITFTVDKDYVTAYKIVANLADLTPLEKSIAISLPEAQLSTLLSTASANELKDLSAMKQTAAMQSRSIKTGNRKGKLLVPMFKYKVEAYGTLERNKNELKENTSVLGLQRTEFKNATHIKIASSSDSRLLVGLNAAQIKQMDQIFIESKIDNQVTTTADLERRLKIGLKFLDPAARVFTRLDADVMHVYEITKISELNETKLRLLKNKAGNQEVMACSDSSVVNYIKSTDKDCVVVLKADVPVSYKASSLALVDLQGNTSNALQFDTVPRSKSVGLVEIAENSAARQVDISGALDPDSSVRIADIKGEFFYRRTFEEASNMFLGSTGMSGDMSIVRFELEDNRLVVRNQQSLITYTGQGPKDREEIMSFPVKYINLKRTSANGSPLAIPVAEASTKEKAEYLIIDWTQNTVPNASSPLSFYGGGECFLATSSQRVANTDMRLATDGVLNFSLSGSYTMKPEMGCVTIKDVNSLYWAGMFQFNFNISERVSFRKRQSLDSDKQFTLNIPGAAQEAFNFGVFTLADKVTTNGTLDNQDGSEKYMPMIHDFRNGKKIKYYVGGINNPAATSPERRQLLVDATTQVVKEWNATLRYAFRGTSLERAGDYIELQFDTAENMGHLGDLDRNYIWYQELPAENGLLGVAQPAANPRSGLIESSNVIIYSGNSFRQAEYQIANTKISRAYEKEKERVMQLAIERAKQEKIPATASQGDKVAASTQAKASLSAADAKAISRLERRIENTNSLLKQSISYLALNNPAMLEYVKGTKISSGRNNQASENLSRPLRAPFKYEVNSKTFVTKLIELASDKKLSSNPHALELAVTSLFAQHEEMDAASKLQLQQRLQKLTLVTRFDESNKSRPGCFEYQRSDINDTALTLDTDENKNLMLNFKKTIASTLSHELGHALGLLHNFQASMDKANYEFPDEKPTGRNYSSIMDYMADIDQHYAGPGPYDAHALRAAYTGFVELPDDKKDNDLLLKVKVTGRNLVSISDVARALGSNSFVSFTKDSLNAKGLIKYYQQCSDGGVGEHATCARFDLGSSPSEVVKNQISDYNRSYMIRNFAYNRINFGWDQKINLIFRNLYLFENIHSYLPESMSANMAGVGLSGKLSETTISDLKEAAFAGYKFFHELIRTPSVDDDNDSLENRLVAVPYTYQGSQEVKSNELNCEKDKSGKINCSGIKVIEARRLQDRMKNRDKIATIGTEFDRYFALQYLVAPTAVKDANGRWNLASYMDFEKMNSLKNYTVQLLTDILTDKVETAFFAPNEKLGASTLVSVNTPVELGARLRNAAVFNSTISLYQLTPSLGYDPLKDAFKVGRSYVSSAPKDRFTVTRLGQDRAKVDTRVFYAAQGAFGVEPIMALAGRNENFANRATTIYKYLADMVMADRTFRQAIIDAGKNACLAAASSEDENKKLECAFVLTATKTQAQYVKDYPNIAKLKGIADQKAAALVEYLRQQNKFGGLMSLELDAENSANNFARQVDSARSSLIANMDLINDFMASLRINDLTKKRAEAQLTALAPTFVSVAYGNSVLSKNNLGAITLDYIQQAAQAMTLNTVDGSKVTGAMIAAVILPTRTLAQKQNELVQLISDLSDYSSLLDPDTNSVR